jgi:peptide methionine sulfoxide reductase msrA/msrB
MVWARLNKLLERVINILPLVYNNTRAVFYNWQWFTMFKYASLTPDTLKILQFKGTEAPFTAKSSMSKEPGTYLCRGCGLALFRGTHMFHSGCGWPSFDAEIPGAITRQSDLDGKRSEILCARCQGHLGHVFNGEGFTAENIRHCVNSLAIEFVSNPEVLDSQEIILAAGCFWGVEHLFKQLAAILSTEVGYIGGTLAYPSYEDVCNKTSGHFEAIRLVFDPARSSVEKILQYFFEIHDFSQTDGQGPDKGPQYLSAIFYYDAAQKQAALAIIQHLQTLGHKVATQVLAMQTFWPAEKYHQAYYQKTGKAPYCHSWRKIFI